MVAFVGIIGALQILGGILVYCVAKSAIHEILGAIMFGMGVTAVALGALIERADKQLHLMNREPAPVAAATLVSREPVMSDRG